MHCLLALFNGMNIHKTKDHLQQTSHTGFVAVEFCLTICETTSRVQQEKRWQVSIVGTSIEG